MGRFARKQLGGKRGVTMRGIGKKFSAGNRRKKFGGKMSPGMKKGATGEENGEDAPLW